MSFFTLAKWGNATGVRIPKPFLKQLRLEAGDKVNITLEKNELVISKADPSLEDMLEGYTASTRHEEHFKEPYGKEAL